MQVKIIKAAALCLAVLLGIGIYLVGCTKKPTQPPPVEPKDYDVYFSDKVYTSKLFRYNTGTGDIETFTMPYNLQETGFGISPDGATMYLHPDGYIVKVALDSLTVLSEEPVQIHEHDPPGTGREVIISPNGQYLAIVSWYLSILNLTDFTVVYSDTTAKYRFGRFSEHCDKFYCSGNDSTGYFARRVNLNDTAATSTHYFEGLYPGPVIPSSNDEILYLYHYISYGVYQFQVYNIVLDSTLFRKDMCPGFGDLEITPDDKFVFYSQPGTPQMYCPAPGYFSVYGTNSNSIEREVWTYIDPQIGVHPIGELCVTPDGKHLIGIATQEGRLFDYDIRADSVIRFVYTDEGDWLYSLKGQSNK